jgi:hypothetical protein
MKRRVGQMDLRGRLIPRCALGMLDEDNHTVGQVTPHLLVLVVALACILTASIGSRANYVAGLHLLQFPPAGIPVS